MRPIPTLIVISLLAFLTDQASKLYVVHIMQAPDRGSIGVIPPFLNFRYVENYGVNFGLLEAGSPIGKWLLIALTLGVVVYILKWLWPNLNRRSAIFGGLIVGGALGNIWDRIYQGFVTDFINNSLPNWNNPFSYNVADIWIFVGLFGLIFFSKTA